MPPGPTQVLATARPPLYGQSYPQNSRQPLLNPPDGNDYPGPIFSPDSPFNGGPPDGGEQAPLLPFNVTAEEAMTGRIMFGVGVNSRFGFGWHKSRSKRQNFDWTLYSPRVGENPQRQGLPRRRAAFLPGSHAGHQVCSGIGQLSGAIPVLIHRWPLGLSGYYYTRV